MANKEQFEQVGGALLVRAPGKINLCLLVAGKRKDGYHDIESIMAKIDWYDEILIEPGRQAGIELICGGPEWSPEGEQNLVYKAAKLAFETSGRSADVKITLTKNVPAGAGLGSGSSDAAATLMGINEYCKLGLDKDELAELAAKLGSDVAFFLDGPLALCTGRGEKVEKLNWYKFSALLVIPNISVSTQRVYANYRHDEGTYKQLHEEISGYIEKNRIDLVCGMCANVLQESCFEIYTELREHKKRNESPGVGPMCLSGSGSSMYCIVNNSNEEGVRSYREKCNRESGLKSIIVHNNSW